MKAISEVAATALLLVISVALAVFLASAFFNIYAQQQSALASEQAAQYCQLRIVAATNRSGYATLWVYNFGQTPCALSSAYALTLSGNAAAASPVSATVPPSSLLAVNTTLPYGYPGYRLAAANGQTFDWWGR